MESIHAYPWIKSMHVISVIAWMGAQLVLPALLQAHRGQPPGAATLLRVERWLVGWVMNPAMILAFVFGGLMVMTLMAGGGEMPGWLAWKLGLVFVLAALHGRLLRQFWRAADGRVQWEARHYRWVQGLDFLLLAGVVVLVVAKPFP